MNSNSRFVPADISKLKDLTFQNEHQLALWYAAHQIGSTLESELATHVCLHLAVGELTEDAQIRSRSLRTRLLSEMTVDERDQFRGAT